MSRKKAKNRKVRIGVFQGKSAKYNLAILETLFNHGGITNWEIAKQLVPNRELLANEIWYSRSQKIYSVIQRKNGRLDELDDLEYILREEKKYYITAKGQIALFIEKPELFEDFSRTKDLGNALRFMQEKLPSDPSITNGPFGISVNGQELKNGYQNLLRHLNDEDYALETIKALVDETKELISQGIDLDLVNIKTLTYLLTGRMNIEKKIRKYIRG